MNANTNKIAINPISAINGEKTQNQDISAMLKIFATNNTKNTILIDILSHLKEGDSCSQLDIQVTVFVPHCNLSLFAFPRGS